MLKFAKYAPYMPDPAPARPFITDDDRARAAETPPQAVPFHCKPWVDGQTVGYTLFYGYLSPITIIGRADDQIEVEGHKQATQERRGSPVVQQFARGHFGLGSGYTLRTPLGMVSLLIPANRPPEGLELLTGLVETDWYPKPLFLVYKLPAVGQTIRLDFRDELARVVVIPRPQAEAPRPLTGEELTYLEQQAAQYRAEEADTSRKWVDARGQDFTHVYKLWSQRNRKAADE